MLPVLLLIFGAALDLGRLFYAHVAIENAAKEGALYGANNPACDGPSDECLDPNNVRWHVETESIGIPDVGITISCSSGSVNECEADDFYEVTVASTFTMVTPILTPVFGSSFQLTSTASSLVVNGAPDSDEEAEELPEYRDCTVPDLDGEKFEDAQQLWTNARFTGIVSDSPSMSSTHRIGWQSLAEGSVWADCDMDITVSKVPPAADPDPDPDPDPPAPPEPGVQCSVPTLVGKKLGEARSIWSAAGFTGAFTGGGTNENKRVLDQSQPAGASLSCTSGIAVSTVT